MLALYAEFNNPGAVVPGVVGLIFILLAIFAFNLLPTRFAALALIVAAFILFGLEVKFASHGVLGIGGTVMMVIGALLLVDAPIPEMRIRLLTALSVSVPIALVTIFLMSIAYKARMNKVITGEEGMIGEIGTAQTALAPEGKVFVHGETWNAVCPEHALPGDRVRVTQVHGLHLQVARLETQKASAQQTKADRIVSS
jgi:membrane-bound serine protease (ClpP class)